jgi:uncharacterized protein YjbI with pentapeptide repeats
MKFEIKHRFSNEVLFSIETDSWKLAVEAAIKSKANLRFANLSFANLSSADLSFADLSSANLRFANLSFANLSSADLSSADLSSANLRSADLSSANLRSADLSSADLSFADLRSADLSSADLRSADLSSANLRSAKNIPQSYVNLASRDILFVLLNLKKEVPALRKSLIAGRVNGSQYEGDCACLIGTLANADGGLDKVCSAIPFYQMGTENPGEAWFLNIREGDTPETNPFSAHAVALCDLVIKNKMHEWALLPNPFEKAAKTTPEA